MSVESNLRFIGWCREVGKGTDEKPEHDKIWGYMVKEGRATTFWGRRTANLTFKRVDVGTAVEQASEKQFKKGYHETSWDELKKLDPEFEDRFHEKLALTMLGNYYHRAGESYAQ